MNVSLTITANQAQAVYDLIDKEVRVNGAQAAMLYSPVVTELVRAVQEAQKAEKENTESESFLQEEDSLNV